MNSIKVVKAILSIVPNAKCTYWETRSDCTNWENPIDGLVWDDERQKPTWQQIGEQIIINDFIEIKQKKLKELNDYYNSDECWLFKIVAGNASLTKTANWFARMIPACLGQQFVLFVDNGQTISFNLTQEAGQKLNHKIQVIESFRILQARNNCENLINDCDNEEELNLIDIKTYLYTVLREIDLYDL